MFHLIPEPSCPPGSKDPAHFLRRLISKYLPGTGPRFCSGFRTAWTQASLFPSLANVLGGQELEFAVSSLLLAPGFFFDLIEGTTMHLRGYLSYITQDL